MNSSPDNPTASSGSDPFTFVLLFSAWVVASTATVGSLFFSEVMQLPPCNLCWYQRIGMYPLVLLFGVALFRVDRRVTRYTAPLIVVGWAIALYHNLIYYGIIPEEVAPCSRGIPCTAIQLEWLGFITIPMMSFVAFTLLGGLSFLLMKKDLPK